MIATLLVFTPLVVGGVLVALGRRADHVAGPIAISTATGVAVLAVVAAVLRPSWAVPFLPGLAVTLAVDGLGAALVLTVAGVTLAVLVSAYTDLGRHEARARFFGLMLLFSGAMLVTVVSASLLPLLMAWEVMGAASYALIGFWWQERRRVAAGTISFLTTRGADLGFYLAAAAAYAGSGSLEVARLADLPSPYVHLAAAGLLLAAAGKSAQLPFSFWLSRAMEGPSPVSALLHSATMVAAGSFLLLRVEPLLRATGWALPAAVGIGLTTAVLLGIVAVWQRDIKQLLAASTSAQMGFMFVAVGAGSVLAGSTHLIAHAATKSLLFLVAGAWLTSIGSKQLGKLRGAGRSRPTAGVPFAIGVLSLAGVPPLAMWVSKDAVLAAALAESAWLWLGMLVATALSATYAGLLLGVAFGPGGRPDAGRTAMPLARSPLARSPLVGLATAVVLLAALGLPTVAGHLRQALGDRQQHALEVWAVLVAAVLAVGTAALAATRAARGWLPRTDSPAATGPVGWLRLEGAVRAAVLRPMLGMATACARFDDRVLDNAVEGVGRGVVRLGGWMRHRVEEPVLDDAVDGLGRAARALGRLARRPQTGLLHQYYAQAVVILLALLLVLLLWR